MALPAILGGAQALIGIGQSVFGGIKAKKAQRELEGMINTYKPNESILDYYSKALNKYNANPYTGAGYAARTKGIDRQTSAAIAGATDRRSGLGMLPSIIQGQSDAYGNAAAEAEAKQAQDLAQLGQATGMKAGEDKYKFEAKYNLLSQKAGAANQGVNAGLSNIMGGLGSIQDYAMINKMYGNGGGGGGSDWTTKWKFNRI